MSIALYGYGFTPTGGTIHPPGTVFVDGVEVILDAGVTVEIDTTLIEAIADLNAMRTVLELAPSIECELRDNVDIELEGGIGCG